MYADDAGLFAGTEPASVYIGWQLVNIRKHREKTEGECEGKGSLARRVV